MSSSFFIGFSDSALPVSDWLKSSSRDPRLSGVLSPSIDDAEMLLPLLGAVSSAAAAAAVAAKSSVNVAEEEEEAAAVNCGASEEFAEKDEEAVVAVALVAVALVVLALALAWFRIEGFPDRVDVDDEASIDRIFLGNSGF